MNANTRPDIRNLSPEQRAEALKRLQVAFKNLITPEKQAEIRKKLEQNKT